MATLAAFASGAARADGRAARTPSSSADDATLGRLQSRDVASATPPSRSGDSTSRSKRVDGVRVAVVGTRATSASSPAALRRAANAFRKMQRWYGGYDLPISRSCSAIFPFGGSEYPGLVFSTPDNATIAHEVAHQWFYGLVGSDQYRDPLLDESITAFVENRFHKSYRCDLARPLSGRAWARRPAWPTGRSTRRLTRTRSTAAAPARSRCCERDLGDGRPSTGRCARTSAANARIRSRDVG